MFCVVNRQEMAVNVFICVGSHPQNRDVVQLSPGCLITFSCRNGLLKLEE
jgi:hypothetical protein